jgi:hypothetical protein
MSKLRKLAATSKDQSRGLRSSCFIFPHSSRHVPAEERRAIRLDDEALDGELLRVTDAHTDELFPLIRS